MDSSGYSMLDFGDGAGSMEAIHASTGDLSYGTNDPHSSNHSSRHAAAVVAKTRRASAPAGPAFSPPAPLPTSRPPLAPPKRGLGTSIPPWDTGKDHPSIVATQSSAAEDALVPSLNGTAAGVGDHEGTKRVRGNSPPPSRTIDAPDTILLLISEHDGRASSQPLLDAVTATEPHVVRAKTGVKPRYSPDDMKPTVAYMEEWGLPEEKGQTHTSPSPTRTRESGPATGRPARGTRGVTQRNNKSSDSNGEGDGDQEEDNSMMHGKRNPMDEFPSAPAGWTPSPPDSSEVDEAATHDDYTAYMRAMDSLSEDYMEAMAANAAEGYPSSGSDRGSSKAFPNNSSAPRGTTAHDAASLSQSSVQAASPITGVPDTFSFYARAQARQTPPPPSSWQAPRDNQGGYAMSPTLSRWVESPQTLAPHALSLSSIPNPESRSVSCYDYGASFVNAFQDAGTGQPSPTAPPRTTGAGGGAPQTLPAPPAAGKGLANGGPLTIDAARRRASTSAAALSTISSSSGLAPLNASGSTQIFTSRTNRRLLSSSSNVEGSEFSPRMSDSDHPYSPPSGLAGIPRDRCKYNGSGDGVVRPQVTRVKGRPLSSGTASQASLFTNAAAERLVGSFLGSRGSTSSTNPTGSPPHSAQSSANSRGERRGVLSMYPSATSGSLFQREIVSVMSEPPVSPKSAAAREKYESARPMRVIMLTPDRREYFDDVRKDKAKKRRLSTDPRSAPSPTVVVSRPPTRPKSRPSVQPVDVDVRPPSSHVVSALRPADAPSTSPTTLTGQRRRTTPNTTSTPSSGSTPPSHRRPSITASQPVALVEDSLSHVAPLADPAKKRSVTPAALTASVSPRAAPVNTTIAPSLAVTPVAAAAARQGTITLAWASQAPRALPQPQQALLSPLRTSSFPPAAAVKPLTVPAPTPAAAVPEPPSPTSPISPGPLRVGDYDLGISGMSEQGNGGGFRSAHENGGDPLSPVGAPSATPKAHRRSFVPPVIEAEEAIYVPVVSDVACEKRGGKLPAMQPGQLRRARGTSRTSVSPENANLSPRQAGRRTSAARTDSPFHAPAGAQAKDRVNAYSPHSPGNKANTRSTAANGTVKDKDTAPRVTSPPTDSISDLLKGDGYDLAWYSEVPDLTAAAPIPPPPSSQAVAFTGDTQRTTSYPAGRNTVPVVDRSGSLIATMSPVTAGPSIPAVRPSRPSAYMRHSSHNMNAADPAESSYLSIRTSLADPEAMSQVSGGLYPSRMGSGALNPAAIGSRLYRATSPALTVLTTTATESPGPRNLVGKPPLPQTSPTTATSPPSRPLNRPPTARETQAKHALEHARWKGVPVPAAPSEEMKRLVQQQLIAQQQQQTRK